VAPHAIIMQNKTQRPVQSGLIEPKRDALSTWIAKVSLTKWPACFHAACASMCDTAPTKFGT
jgi:hypothetical protein